MNGQDVPAQYSLKAKQSEIHFDFSLSGSTHNFRTNDKSRISFKNDNGKLNISYNRIGNGNFAKVFYKPFYRREDFDDERYLPVFSPKANSGQSVRFELKMCKFAGEGLQIIPYVRNTFDKSEILCGGAVETDENWKTYDFIIPDLHGSCPDEIGFIIDGYFPDDDINEGSLLLRNFCVSGLSEYSIDMDKQAMEFQSVTPFSTDGGSFTIEDGALQCLTNGFAQAMTGNYYNEDVELSANVTPLFGEWHMLGVRIKGARYGVYAGFSENGQAAIVEVYKGQERVLAALPFQWEYGSEYRLTMFASGDKVSFHVNDKKVLSADGVKCDYGMVSFAKFKIGRTQWKKIIVKEQKNR